MQLVDVTRLFRILSDPTRLRLMRLIAEAELSVMELAEITQLGQSRISNHLKVLREEGLVQERREGPWRHYRIDEDRLPAPARQLWEPIQEAWGGDDQTSADQARLEDLLARRQSQNGKIFDQLAEQWDTIRLELFGDSIARDILRFFIPPDLVVADIGCGTGYVMELFGDRPRRLIGIDTSEAMLSVARNKAEVYGWSNAEFRVGDAHEPPLGKGEAGFVTAVMLLQHLDRPADSVKAVGNALTEGSRYLISDFASHQHTWLRETMKHRQLGFSRQQIEDWLSEAGFHLDEWIVLPGRDWTTPDGRKVTVPNGFVCISTKGAAS